MSCDPLRPFGDPVTQCHAPGSGKGLGLGQANGTDQQHPTPLLKRKRCGNGVKRKEEGKKKSRPRHNLVGITYIFITLSRTVFILDQKEKGKRRKCVWAWVRGIKRSVFTFIFLELVNMFVLHGSLIVSLN